MAAVDHRPTPEQLRVIKLEGGPARVLAGAGSGKTATMTRLVERHVYEHARGWGTGTAPERVLALTFTVKAAEEMRRRLLDALGNQALKLTVSNFHSHALEIVRENSTLLNVEADAPVLRRGRAWLMVLEELAAEDLALRRLDLSDPATAADRMLKLLSSAKNDLVELGDLRRRTEQDLKSSMATEQMKSCFEERLDLVELAQRFEARREARGLLRHEDMISLAARILDDPQTGAPYLDRYDLVVVDEFQDTNPAQLKLVELLAGGDLSRVVVIGDDLQSIYNFTGASIRNIQTFEERAGVPVGSHTYPLSVNFRSGRRVLELANHLAVRVYPENSPDEPKLLSASDGAPQGKIDAFVEVSDAEEARGIAARIDSLVQGGVQPGRCAVLIRRWSQAGPVLGALADKGIPCEVAEGGDLLSRREVTLVCDYLRLVASPGGVRDALLRILARHPVLLSQADLRAVFGAPGGHHSALGAPDSVPGLSGEGRERLRALGSTLAELEGELAAADSLGTFVERTVEVTGVGPELRSSPSPGARLAVQFLDIFFEVAREFGDVAYIEEFVRYLEIMDESTSSEQVSPPSEEPDAVRVMTVHRAKGLEFEHVFVPGLSKELFPYARKPESPLEKAHVLPPALKLNPAPETTAAYAAFDPAAMKEALEREALEEEGRLFYVAATRAGSTLTLSRAYYYLRNKNPKKPGGFWELLESAPEEAGLSFSSEPEVPDANPTLVEDGREEREPVDRFPLEAASASDEAEAAELLGVSGWEEELRELRRDVHRIPEQPRPQHVLPAPETHSPSSLMDFETCPRRYYYDYIFPVPALEEELGEARDYGSVVHAYIEGGMHDAPPEPGGARPGDGGGPSCRELWEAFAASEYGRRAAVYPLHEGPEPPKAGPARLVEVPFALPLEDTEIRGRIDAIFVDEDGTFHLVDWKTGKPRESYAERLQLPLYALAANRLWGIEPRRIRLAYAFAPGDAVVEVDTEDGFLEHTEDRVLDALGRIRSRRFEPRPSRYACSHCPVIGIGIEGCPTGVPAE